MDHFKMDRTKMDRTKMDKANMNKGNVDKTVFDFRQYMIKQDLSGNTIMSYCGAVRMYYSKFSEVSIDYLQLFKEYLVENYKPSTANLRIHGMNHYLKYFAGKPECPGEIKGYQLSSVKIQQTLYLDNVITKKDYEKLKRRLKKDNKIMWYYIVRFMAATGARVSELLKVKVENIKTGYIDLYTKGGKVRRIFIPDNLKDEMLTWLSNNKTYTGYVFVNRSGQPLSARGIRSQLKVFAGRYHIPEATMYPHSFRHRFAKNFLAKFNDISLLADLMGHDSIETTRIYLTKSTLEQRALIDKVVVW